MSVRCGISVPLTAIQTLAGHSGNQPRISQIHGDQASFYSHCMGRRCAPPSLCPGLTGKRELYLPRDGHPDTLSRQTGAKTSAGGSPCSGNRSSPQLAVIVEWGGLVFIRDKRSVKSVKSVAFFCRSTFRALAVSPTFQSGRVLHRVIPVSDSQVSLRPLLN